MDTLDERILVIWLFVTLSVAVAVGLVVGVVDRLFVGVGAWLGPATFVSTTFVGSVHATACYRTYRFEFDSDTLYLERGVVTRVRTVVPVSTVYRVDVRRSPFERLVGLQRLVVYPDGPRSAAVAIPGLSDDRARGLQDRLRANPQRQTITAED